MDGVLVDSEPVIEASAIRALKEYGVDARPEDFRPFVGAGDDMYIGGVARKYGLEYERGMKERLYEIYLRLAEDRIEVFRGARGLLEKLASAGCRLALASSADALKVEANLRAAGISRAYFKCVVTGEDVRDKKPSPEIYLKTAQQLNIPPGLCLVVEDALNGIRAARSAGMVCAAVASSFQAAELRRAGADYVCGEIGEVYGVFLKHNENQKGPA